MSRGVGRRVPGTNILELRFDAPLPPPAPAKQEEPPAVRPLPEPSPRSAEKGAPRSCTGMRSLAGSE